MSGPFKVGLVQMSMSSRPEDNLEKAAARVRDAARAGAQVVCLPELYRTPYFCQKEDQALFDLAETVPGPSTETLGRAAKEAGVTVVVPIFEQRAPGLYHNSAVVVGPEGRPLGLPQDAHPRRPALLREVLFHAGRPR